MIPSRGSEAANCKPDSSVTSENLIIRELFDYSGILQFDFIILQFPYNLFLVKEFELGRFSISVSQQFHFSIFERIHTRYD